MKNVFLATIVLLFSFLTFNNYIFVKDENSRYYVQQFMLCILFSLLCERLSSKTNGHENIIWKTGFVASVLMTFKCFRNPTEYDMFSILGFLILISYFLINHKKQKNEKTKLLAKK